MYEIYKRDDDDLYAFKVEGKEFTVDNYELGLFSSNYVFMEITGTLINEINGCFIYDEDNNEIIWDYCIPHIELDTNGIEILGENILMMFLGNPEYVILETGIDSHNKKRALIKFRCPIFTDEYDHDADSYFNMGSIEKRMEVEELFFSHIKDIVETINLIKCEYLLD